MRTALLVTTIAITTFLLGCDDATINTSSDEAMKESISQMKDDLPPEKREDFEKALMTISLGGDNLLELAAAPGGVERRMKERLDGKTADEVFAEAEKVRAEAAARHAQRERERRAEQVEQLRGQIVEVQQEVAELREKQQAAKDAESKLKKFAVKRSRFYRNTEGFSRGDPIIELTVENGLEQPVSRAYFRGILATPNRSVPWVNDTFNYQIRGGLEPGEEATWKLSPNMFGEWGGAPRDRDDMVLTVNVVRVDGPDQEPLFNSEFEEWDQKRLTSLLEQEGTIRQQLSELAAKLQEEGD